mgnify:CR=1 FL=1
MSTNIRGRRGFTLIELLVIIAVIGILAATTAIGMAIYQSQARDAQRAAGASVIVEGLERYYLANGEYPGCELLSGNINTVGDMLGINPEALTAPGAEKGTNSLRCEVAEGDEDAVYLTALFASGSRADLARDRGISRAAVTQRLTRIKSRIDALPRRQQSDAKVWIEELAHRSSAGILA